MIITLYHIIIIFENILIDMNYKYEKEKLHKKYELNNSNSRK